MRFIFGVIVGVALALGIALYHDDNLPANPQTLADQPIVNWAVLGEVTHNATAMVGSWWDGLLGRAGTQTGTNQ